MSGVLILMVSTSIIIGFVVLAVLLWAIRTRQFDDDSRFLNATKFDSEDALNDAYEMEQKRKAAKENREKKYRPE